MYQSRKEAKVKDNFLFKKKFGQNFIKDNNIIRNIVDKSNIDKNTLVIEIGPGSGSLTAELIEKAGMVISYEIDETLKPILEKKFNGFDNLKIVYKDFLKVDVLEDIKEFKYNTIYVVANLPYYITTPIITKIVEIDVIDKLVIMVQKEVGNRFKASPNTKDYNSLSIYLNYYFDIKKLMDVSRNVFVPVPNVDSIIVELKRKKETLYLKDEKLFFKLVKDSFVQKRKTLKNNLIGYDLIKVEEVLRKYNMDLSVRAEGIPIEVFVEIANTL